MELKLIEENFIYFLLQFTLIQLFGVYFHQDLGNNKKI